MNFAHLHLILTHFPPVLSLAGALSAAAGFFLPRRRADTVRLALVLLIAVGAIMPLVYLAGDRTADSIGRVEGIQQEAIAPHQRAATIALASSVLAALIAGALLIIERRRGSLPARLRLLLFSAAMGSALAVGWTAALGGEIHHPEARGAINPVLPIQQDGLLGLRLVNASPSRFSSCASWSLRST